MSDTGTRGSGINPTWGAAAGAGTGVSAGPPQFVPTSPSPTQSTGPLEAIAAPLRPPTPPTRPEVSIPAFPPEPSPTDPPGSHRLRARWLIPLFVIVLLGAGVIGAGWFGLGFGVPKDPLKALGLMATNLERQSSYHIVGEAVITIGPPTLVDQVSTGGSSGPDRLFSRVIAMSPADDGLGLDETDIMITISFDSRQNHEDEFDAKLTVSGTGLSDYLVDGADSIDVAVRHVNRQLYLRVPILSLLVGSDRNPWFEFAAADLASMTGTTLPTSQTFDPQSLFVSGERLGYQQIDGDWTGHYVAELDLRPLMANAAEAQSSELDLGVSSLPPVQIEWWMGLIDRLPHRIEIYGSQGDDQITTDLAASFTFDDYGQSFAIEAPSETEIDRGGFLDLLASDAGGSLSAGLEIEARDAQRKADLLTLQSALELYQFDTGAYPITGADIAKTNVTGNQLEALILRDYLIELPVDPLNEKYFYGYTSVDGAAYELWSIVETPNDPDAVLKDGYTVYRLTSDEGDRSSVPSDPSSLPTSQVSYLG